MDFMLCDIYDKVSKLILGCAVMKAVKVLSGICVWQLDQLGGYFVGKLLGWLDLFNCGISMHATSLS
jgi:hypothetical protein